LDMRLVSLLITSFIIAHTINWMLNCNHFVIYVHRMKWLKTSKNSLFKHLISIQERLEGRNWALAVVSLGGISRGTMNKHSDIDVNIIRKPGIKNAILALLFGVIEKKRADYYGIPLDILISDSIQDCIKKSEGQKNPVILYNSFNIIDKYYKEKISINDAKLLNNVPI